MRIYRRGSNSKIEEMHLNFETQFDKNKITLLTNVLAKARRDLGIQHLYMTRKHSFVTESLIKMKEMTSKMQVMRGKDIER